MKYMDEENRKLVVAQLNRRMKGKQTIYEAEITHEDGHKVPIFSIRDTIL